MDLSSKDTLSKINDYATQTRSMQENSMEIDSPADTATEARLSRTVKELRARVNEQRQALEQVSTFTTALYTTRLLTTGSSEQGHLI